MVLAIILLAIGLLSVRGVLVDFVGSITPPDNADENWSPLFRGTSLPLYFNWVTHLVGSWIFAYLGFAFFLSTLGLRGGINWFLTVGVSVLLILLSIGRLATVPFRQHAEMTMFSPIVTLISLPEATPRFPTGGPEIDGCVVGHWVVGSLLIFAGLAIMRAQKLPWIVLRRPGYEFLIEPPAAPEAGALKEEVTSEGPAAVSSEEKGSPAILPDLAVEEPGEEEEPPPRP